MADEYGPIFTVKVGVHRTLIVSSWEVAKQCLTINDRIFASRPQTIGSEVLGYNYAMFSFSPYGIYWRNMRKIATLNLLTAQRLELSKHIREAEVQVAVNRIYKQWASGGDQPRKVAVDMKRWFSDITTNVIFKMIVGKQYGEKQDGICRQIFRDFLELGGSFIVSDAFPFLRWLDLDGNERRMKNTARKLDRMVQVWLEDHKNRRNFKERFDIDDKDQGFMDVMLSVLDAELVPGYDADTVIKATCMVLALGTTDSTAATLVWSLSLLLNHSGLLKRAQHELDTVIGRDRQVMESDIKNLTYIHAIIKETLRLYPPVPLAVPHQSVEDCTTNGYHVPKGTRLFFNLRKIQRDPKVWRDPSKFRPERFLTSHRDCDVRGQHFELIPFGSGRRMCPGVSLALLIVPLTLARLLHQFELTTPENEPVDMTEGIGFTNLKATPLDVLASPRLPEGVYR